MKQLHIEQVRWSGKLISESHGRSIKSTARRPDGALEGRVEEAYEAHYNALLNLILSVPSSQGTLNLFASLSAPG